MGYSLRQEPTEKQIDFMRLLERKLKKTMGRDVSNMSRAQVSNYIDKMKQQLEEREGR